MPVIRDPGYRAPYYLFNGHLQTIVPSLLRKTPLPFYERERITLPDADFLDLDWARTGSRQLVIISHGLEGDTSRPYVKGMAAAMNRLGLDALAWNFRGCSGESNRLLRAYHSGATEDLDQVVRHVQQTRSYEHLALVGFSLGGNLTLKYLGEKGTEIDPRIKSAVAISVPCDLQKSAEQLGRLRNRMYQKRFIRSLRES